MPKMPGILKGLLITGIVALLSTGLFFITHTANNSDFHSLVMQIPAILDKPSSAPTSGNWKTYTVQPGDTLSGIFKKLGLDQRTLMAITSLKLDHLRDLQPQQNIDFLIQNQKLTALKYSIDFKRYALVSVNGDNPSLQVKNKPIKSSLEFKSATVERSLHEAAYRIGMTPSMLAQLEHIFRGSINFDRDIHKGDHFAILYNEYYIDGKKYHPGNIVAAEFINNGKKHRAVRFTYPADHTGYYTPLGHAVQALFLRFPVHFIYISGHFTYHRFDPYLHQWRTHLGVDFAANRGTPIHSIGNGRIVFIGHDGGYGNCIKIRYGRHYEGLYGHMHQFARGLKLHQYIHKGQIIGYVGSTGWSTGPHLHFSFFVNGVPHDWLKFHMPRADPIPRSYIQQYEATAHQLLNTMALYEHEQ